MYNRSKRSKAAAFGTQLKTGLTLLAVVLLGVFGFKGFTGGQVKKIEAVAQQSVSKSSIEDADKDKDDTEKTDEAESVDEVVVTQEDVSLVEGTQEISDATAVAEGQVADMSANQAAVYAEQPVTYDTVAYNVEVSNNYATNSGYQGQTYYNLGYTYTSDYSNSSGVVLANGNTAGDIGSAAAAQIAAMTATAPARWEYIIARESNGDPNAYNASGASGLFQTMPGWGSTATVQDQINAAVNAYNAQGFSAWGF